MSFTLGEIVGQNRPRAAPTDAAKVAPDVECPSGKVAFVSKRAACDALRKTPPDGPSRRGVFRCGFCERYHIGHERGAPL